MNTPSSNAVAEATRPIIVTDVLGRFIECRHPTALDRFRLFRAIGPMHVNEHYLGMAMLAVCATSIDGVPLPFPTSEAALDAAIYRLGAEGMDAVAPALRHPVSAHEDQAPGN